VSEHFPVVMVTTKNGPWARSKTWTTRKECVNVNHARNYAKKVIAPTWVQMGGRWQNVNRTLSVVVWLDAETKYVWKKSQGWVDREGATK